LQNEKALLLKCKKNNMILVIALFAFGLFGISIFQSFKIKEKYELPKDKSMLEIYFSLKDKSLKKEVLNNILLLSVGICSTVISFIFLMNIE
jgi:hypothetical protein